MTDRDNTQSRRRPEQEVRTEYDAKTNGTVTRRGSARSWRQATKAEREAALAAAWGPQPKKGTGS